MSETDIVKCFGEDFKIIVLRKYNEVTKGDNRFNSQRD